MSHPLTRKDLSKWRAEVLRDVQFYEQQMAHDQYRLAQLKAQLAWLDVEIEKKNGSV